MFMAECPASILRVEDKATCSSQMSVNFLQPIPTQYRTVILPVVLYGNETLSLTLREEHRLRVFQNKVPKKIFGATREEITGDWRKLRNELHGLYSSPNII
jgi:hypothetical protein